MFEVVVGGWGNSQSVIRNVKQGPALAVYAGAVDSTAAYQTFVLDWSTGAVALYKLDASGARQLLMATPPQPSVAITAVGLATGWGATGDWLVSRMVCPA